MNLTFDRDLTCPYCGSSVALTTVGRPIAGTLTSTIVRCLRGRACGRSWQIQVTMRQLDPIPQVKNPEQAYPDHGRHDREHFTFHRIGSSLKRVGA